jgi:hypothetical protein
LAKYQTQNLICHVMTLRPERLARLVAGGAAGPRKSFFFQVLGQNLGGKKSGPIVIRSKEGRLSNHTPFSAGYDQAEIETIV